MATIAPLRCLTPCSRKRRERTRATSLYLHQPKKFLLSQLLAPLRVPFESCLYFRGGECMHYHEWLGGARG